MAIPNGIPPLRHSHSIRADEFALVGRHEGACLALFPQQGAHND